jgi:hypothetical protein
VVVADSKATGDVLGEAAEVAPDTLAKRLERLKAGGTLRRMNADALGRTMIDGDKDRDLTLAGDGGAQIGAPHGVDRLGDDGPVVAARPARRAAARGASRSCSRISRSTRRLEVRVPPWRSRAQTLRCPSP